MRYPVRYRIVPDRVKELPAFLLRKRFGGQGSFFMAIIHTLEAYRSQPQSLLDGALARVPRVVQRPNYEKPQLSLVASTTKERLSTYAQSLVAEVATEQEKQQKREESGDRSEPWYYLSGTGFFVHGQVQLFLKDIQQEIRKGKSFTEAVDFASVKVREDVHGFEYEYLKQLAGLKWNIGWKDVDGLQRLYGTDYNGETLESLTGKEEREGALYDAWFTDKPGEGKKGIESWLRDAPVGSKVLLVSPSGWSGYDGFVYPQTQIYYVEIGEGKSIKSFTLRYDVPIEKNEQLQKALGVVVGEARTERDRIKQMLGSPIYIAPDGSSVTQEGEVLKSSQKKIHSPEDVIDLMQEVKKCSVAFADEKFGDRTFDSMHTFIQDPDKFLARHPESDALVHAFEEFAKHEFSQGHSEKETTQRLEIALALVIVQLKRLYLGSAKISSAGHIPVSVYEKHGVDQGYTNDPRGFFQSAGIDYAQELAEIRKLPGCAGAQEEGVSTGSGIRITAMGISREAKSTNPLLECASIKCRQCGWEPGQGEEVGEVCPVCEWAPGKDVDPDWAEKKKKSGQTEKQTPETSKKEIQKEEPQKQKKILPLTRPEVKKIESKKKEMPERRGREPEKKQHRNQ